MIRHGRERISPMFTTQKVLLNLALSTLLVVGQGLSGIAVAADSAALVPNQWVYSKSKIMTHFYKCTSDSCDKSSLFSYHFQDVTGVSADQFKSGISSIAGNFKMLGYKYKLIGKAEKVPAPEGVHYVIYAQKSAITDPNGKTVRQISGLIVGDKISISVDSTADKMKSAQATFRSFTSLIASTLNTYETGFKGKKAPKCIKGKMIPVCFGPT